MLSKIIAVVGTTASGKSDLAVTLAKKFGGEVVSADSRQVFRGLDLGTGKITPEETDGVPHHLIDIIEPERMFSAAEYQTLAYEKIDDILNRGKLPIVCGGTGFYVRAAIKGYNFNAIEVSEEEHLELAEKNPDELVEILLALNSAAANVIDLKNPRRVIRAIEKERRGISCTENSNQPKYDALWLGMTFEREILNERIDIRLKKRFELGMLDEVRGLLERGVSGEFMESLGLEYRYIFRYLDGQYESFSDMERDLSHAIKRFAKRQMTWFRADEEIHWLDMNGDFTKEAERLIEDYLKN